MTEKTGAFLESILLRVLVPFLFLPVLCSIPSHSIPFQAMPNGNSAYYYNVGTTGTYVDTAGRTWQGDRLYDSTSAQGYGYVIAGNVAWSNTGSDIKATDQDSIYYSERWNNELEFRFDVPATVWDTGGCYRVTVKLSENFFTAANQRKFRIYLNDSDVTARGYRIADNLDIFARAGDTYTAYDFVVPFFPCNDGVLKVTLTSSGGVDNPKVCGIAIEKVANIVSDLDMDGIADEAGDTDAMSNDAFLELYERKIFNWFYDNVLPGDQYYLPPSEADINGVSFQNNTSIASISPAIAAYIVGAHRGWISYNDAYTRVYGILKGVQRFKKGPNTAYPDDVTNHYPDAGPFSEYSAYDDPNNYVNDTYQTYHHHYWRDPNSSRRFSPYPGFDRWRSIDDNGDLVIGFWLAQEYFRGTDAEVVARQLVESLDYNKWGLWADYSEKMMMFLASAGSPRASTYNAQAVSAWNDADANGQYGRVLYWSQWPNLWYDGRYTQTTQGTQTGRNDFQVHSNLVKAMRDRSVTDVRALPGEYNSYDYDAWGLSAATQDLSNTGGVWYHAVDMYVEGNAANDKGTGQMGGLNIRTHGGNINPFATVASLPFLATEVTNAMRHMYWRYFVLGWPEYMGTGISGNYGFVQAWNIGSSPKGPGNDDASGGSFFSSIYNAGFDMGPQIVAIENQRSGLVWNLMMANDNMQRAMNRFGMSGWTSAPPTPSSLNKTATASSVRAATNNTANKATDDDKTTRWESEFTDNEWIYIDLGADQTISSVVLWWEPAYAKQYDIQVAANGADPSNDANYATVYTDNGGNGGVDRIPLSPSRTGRYVRMKGRERGTVYAYSLWGFDVFSTELAVPGLIDDFEVASGVNRMGEAMGTFTGGGGTASSNYETDTATGKVYAGIRSRWVTFNVSGGGQSAGFYSTADNGNYDARSYSALSFQVKGASGGEKIQVRVKDTANVEPAKSADSYLTGGITTSWKRVIVPLTDFTSGSAVDLGHLNNVNLYFSNAQGGTTNSTVYIDDLKFVTDAEIPPVPPTYPLIASVGTQIRLKWSDTDPVQIAGYHVYRREKDSGAFARITSTPVTTLYYNDNDAALAGREGTTYEYYMTKLTNGGLESSACDTRTAIYGAVEIDWDDAAATNIFSGTDLGFWGATAHFWTDGVQADGRNGKIRSAEGDPGFGIFSVLPGTNINQYGVVSLRFDVKGNAGGESFQVGLKDRTTSQEVKILMDTVVTTGWQTFVVPLDPFISGGVDMTNLDNISFTFQGAHERYFLDNIMFMPSGGSVILVDNFDASAVDLTNYQGGVATLIASGGDPINVATMANSGAERHSVQRSLLMTFAPGGTQPRGFSEPFPAQLNASATKYLTFWVKGSDALATTDMKVILDDGGANASVSLCTYVIPSMSEWRRAVIPLSDFPGVDTTSLDNIKCQFNASPAVGGSIYFDDIQFTLSAPTSHYGFQIMGPDTWAFGIPLGIVIKATHSDSGLIRTFTGTCSITIPAGDTLTPATATVTNGVGSANITITGDTYGAKTVTVTDSTTTTRRGTRIFQIIQGSFRVETVSVGPYNSGDSILIKITALDFLGDTLTSFAGQVDLEVVPGRIAPARTDSFVAGIRFETVSIHSVGVDTIRVLFQNSSGTRSITMRPPLIVDDFADGVDPNNIADDSFSWPNGNYRGSYSGAASHSDSRSFLFEFDAQAGVTGGIGQGFARYYRGMNVASCTAISFWIRGASGMNKADKLYLGLKATTGVETALLVCSYVVPVTTAWRRAYIPLKDFRGLDTKIVENWHFKIVPDVAGLISGYLDDIRMETDMPDTYIAFEASAPPSVVVGESFSLRLWALHAESGVYPFTSDLISISPSMGSVIPASKAMSRGIMVDSFALTTPGTIVLTATSGGVSCTIPITVLPSGNVIVDDMEGDSRNNLGLATSAWGVASRALVTDQQKSGLASTLWTFNAANGTSGGLEEALGGLNVTSLASLAFWVRADSTLDDTDVRSLYTSIRQNGGAETNLVFDSFVRPVSSEWRRVLIPLSHFTGLDTANLQDFNFIRVSNQSGNTIAGGMYVDDVLFTNDTQGELVDFEVRAPSFARAGDSFMIRIDARHADKGILRSFTDSVSFTTPASLAPDTSGNFFAGIRFETISITQVGAATITVVSATGKSGTTTITITDSSIPIDTFHQLSPVAGLETTSPIVRFEWTMPADTTVLSQFRVQLSRYDSFTPLAVDSIVAATESSAWVSVTGTETYHWRVQAYAISGNTRISLPGDSILVIDTEPPVGFGLSSPSAGADTSATSVTFRWNASSDSHSGLNGYRVQISRDSVFTVPLADSPAGLATESTIALAANDTYYWRVRAIDDLGNIRTTADTFRVVRIDTMPPFAFSLSSPANSLETSGVSIAFSWTSSGDTHSGLKNYRIQLSLSPSFGALLLDSTAALATSTTVLFGGPGLSASDTIFWRVVAYDTAGNATVSSETRTLVVDTEPPVPFTRDTPVNGATTMSNVTIRWNASGDTHSGLASYRVEVSNDSAFGFVAIDTTLAAPDTDLAILLPQDTWFWRVTARDDVGNTRYATNGGGATYDSFVSSPPDDTTPPTIFNQLIPVARTETSAASVTFAWSASTDSIGLAHYRVQLSPSSSFVPLTIDTIVPASRDSAVLSIFGSDTFHWRVMAVDFAANTTVSLPGDSIVVVDTEPPVPFALSLPSNSYETSGLSIPFAWQVATDSHTSLAQYRIQVARVSSFAVLLVDSSNGVSTGTTVMLPGLDTYFWRVVARDTLGNVRISTDTRILFIDTQPPAAFNLSGPPNNLETSFTTIRFSWSASGDLHSGLNRYRIQVARSPIFATLLIDSSALLATETVVILAGTDTYYWKVIAIDDVGNTTTSSETRALYVDTTPPIPFALVSPRNGETVAATATILWGLSGDTHSGLNKYTFEFSRDSLFTLVNFSGSVAVPDTDFIWTPTGNDTWFWRVFAVDDAGNTVAATSAFETFVRPLADTTPPSAFSLSSPADLLETSIALRVFTWSVSSDSEAGLNTYRLQIASDSIFSALLLDSITGVTTTGTTAVPVNDTKYWRVVAVDNNLNTTVSTPSFRRIIVDTIPPSAAPLLSPAQDAETSAVLISFAWTASVDTVSGVKEYRIQVDTSGTFAFNVTDSVLGLVTQTVLSLPANDTYRWRLIVKDDAGNTTTTTDSRFFIDTVPPTSAYPVSPSAGLETNAASIAFSWTASADTLSGLADYRIQVDTLGTFVTLVSDSSTGGIAGGIVTPPANVAYRWRIVSIDRAGNTIASPDSGFTIDTAPPPAPTLRLPSNGVETNVTAIRFTWDTVVDALSGLNRHQIQISRSPAFAPLMIDSTAFLAAETTIALVGTDTYYWRVIAIDDASNTTASSETRTLYVDTTPPIPFAPISPRNGETVLAMVTIIWNPSSDTHTGLNRYTFDFARDSIFSIISFSGSVNAPDTDYIWTPTGNDTWFWRVFAFDDAGNTVAATSAFETFVRLLSDTTPPVSFSLSSPADLLETSTPVQIFTWTASSDSGGGLYSYRLQISSDSTFSVLLVDSLTGITTTGTTTVPANDTRYWRILAVDNSLNTTVSTPSFRRIIVDTVPPTAAPHLAPAQNAETSSVLIGFLWSASTDTLSGVKQYRIQIDTAGTFLANIVDSVVGLVTQASFTLAANDTYRWRLIISDDAGNTTATTDSRFFIDTVPPSAGYPASPVSGLETNATRLLFTWTASVDSLSGISDYRLQVDTLGTFTTLIADSPTGRNPSGTLVIPANSSYRWRVLAIDQAGNTSISVDSGFTIDTVPPPLPTQRGPADVTETRLVSISFSWDTVLDALSGVNHYSIQVDTSGLFISLLADSSTGLSNSGIVTMAPNDTYLWRIFVVDDAGNTNASPPRLFV
ncbi:MAG: carbohydrate binding domain-containing protein, partial [Candidatus Hydrogenedentota bacterium]